MMFLFHSFTYSFLVFAAAVIEVYLFSIVYSCLLCHRLLDHSNSVSKESAPNVGDPGLNPGSGRCPGEGNGNPLQYSCLENCTDRGAWWGHKSWT